MRRTSPLPTQDPSVGLAVLDHKQRDSVQQPGPGVAPRRLRDGISLLADWCDRGVRIVSVTQQIDLSGAVGRMLASVMFGLAEIELEYRCERQAAGIKVAKERGVYQGRKLVTTKQKRAATLRGKGLAIPEIANALGVSERTAFRYLAGLGNCPLPRPAAASD